MKGERLRGVTELPEVLGERRFRARIRRGKGREVNLGVYPTPWLAALAYNVAAEALYGDRRPGNAVPEAEQPTADQVRQVTARVRRRLELDDRPPSRDDRPPDADEIMALFEITVVGFWRGQVTGHNARPGDEIDASARRLVESAHILFRGRPRGVPEPKEAMEQVLSLRLDRVFRRADVTRAVLDDDGDDELRLARWLVHPDDLPGSHGFRAAVARLYADVLGTSSDAESPPWAEVLGITPPFRSEQVRRAYLLRSKSVHPDVGGDPAAFVRLQAAYEEAQRHCASQGT